MTTGNEPDYLVPLETGFDVVWRGYDRSQIEAYVGTAETELQLMSVDRDALSARAEELASQLGSAHSEIAELRAKLDQVCQTPITPEALDERLRHRLELAGKEAAEIVSRAQAAAAHGWSVAEQAARSWRARYGQLVDEAERMRQQMQAGHRAQLAHARARIDAMTRQSEQRRRELDEQADRHRQQAQRDLERTLAARLAEAQRELTERDTASRAEAERRVREATEEANRRIEQAERQVAALLGTKGRVVEQLHAAGDLLARAEQVLQPQPVGSVAQLPPQRTESAIEPSRELALRKVEQPEPA